MKKRFYLVIATFILAFAGIASAQQNNKDFAHANGQLEFEGKVSNFSFTAQRQRDNTVNGTLVYHQRSATSPENNISVHMKINCLTVIGNTATIEGTITRADPESVFVPGYGNFSILGASAYMTVQDGGNGNSAVDLASPLIITGAPGFCSEVYPYEMYRNVNVVVRGGTQ